MKAHLTLTILALSVSVFAEPVSLPTAVTLRKQGLGLVHYSFGTYKSPGSYLDIYTVPTKVFDSQADWDGSTPLPKPIESLIQTASAAVRKGRPSLVVQSIRIEPFDDAPKKRFAIVTFTDTEAHDLDLFEREILILLDGTVATARRIDISEDQVHAIWERGLNKAAKK